MNRLKYAWRMLCDAFGIFLLSPLLLMMWQARRDHEKERGSDE